MDKVGRLSVCMFGCLCALALPPAVAADDKVPMPPFVRVSCKGHTAELASVAFSADGKQLATASFDRTVRLWNTTTGRLTHIFTGHTHEVWAVAISRDSALQSQILPSIRSSRSRASSIRSTGMCLGR